MAAAATLPFSTRPRQMAYCSRLRKPLVPSIGSSVQNLLVRQLVWDRAGAGRSEYANLSLYSRRVPRSIQSQTCCPVAVGSTVWTAATTRARSSAPSG